MLVTTPAPTNWPVASWLPEGRVGSWHTLRCNNTLTGLIYKNIWVSDDFAVTYNRWRSTLELAQGRVVVTGLGVGAVAVYLASLPLVEVVDVIENTTDVLRLVGRHINNPKINLIHADALKWQPPGHYAWAYHDIYQRPSEKNMSLISEKYAAIADQQMCWRTD